jgi:hypothetical protein
MSPMIILSNELATHFKRSQFCFKLNTLVIIEVDVIDSPSRS